MPCFLAVVGAFAPRTLLFFIWLLTSWTSVFTGYFFPIMGFLFMPYATLGYLYMAHDCFMGIGVFGLCLIFDLLSWVSALGSSKSSEA